ncbi:SusC/RagA family TonB-linked outer membrane protein [Pinibacter soli]|uniref:TonB-dependent receptor n=1 Tax=Pinibacter soli TaxID=3044211 RepID=A0ABT6R738_9BACT|nr:TonB-dependent receptor [Pinibacter soli]MDI3318384.1 TonB-dependent receptor [Pinibacter soli]
MRKMQRFISLSFVILLCTLKVYAQQRVVHGKVVDQNSQPLVGATVNVKSTTRTTVTDASGAFSIKANTGEILEMSYAGYLTQDIPISNDEKNLFIKLTLQQGALSDVVVVGYGTQKKTDLTGAVTTVDVDKTLVGKPFTDLGKGLQGAVPGLQITYGNGGIATDPSIQIRGMYSINGSSTPLILVDGIAVPDINMVNPNDIASISVLKDAASTSIFGTRAAGGVILIKTKSGNKNSKPTVTYSNNFSWGKPTSIPSFADPEKEIPMEQAAALRAGGSYDMFGANPTSLVAGISTWKQKYAGNRKSDEMVLGEDFSLVNGVPNFYRIWDPVDIMFQTMPSNNHNLSFSGGTDKISYYLSGSYSHDEGILKIHPDKLNKYNFIAGITADVTKWLTLDAKMSDRQYNYDYPYGYQDYFFYMWRWGANMPYGTYTNPATGNSYYFRNDNGYIANANNCTFRQNTPNINVAATVKFTPWLSLRSDFSYLYQSGIRHETGGLMTLWDFWGGSLLLNNALPSASANETDFTNSYTTQLTSNTYLTYNQKFGVHNLKAVAGVNAEKGEFQQTFAKGYGLMDNSRGEIALVSNTQPPVITTTGVNYAPGHTWWSTAGFFGRVNYDYKSKYLLEVAARYDGSSNFPIDDRWAFFPSASAGWRITEEPFMENVKNVINEWKIRASYGTIGNQNLGPTNLFLPTMNTSTSNWIAGGAKTVYTGMPQVVPSSLTWEKINTLNFGTDMKLLKNLDVTVDWFQRDNVGMVAPSASLPATFGTAPGKANMGTLRTTGWEVGLNYQHRFTNGIQFYANATVSNYKTVITKWQGNDANSLNASQFYAGENVGEIWGFKTAGYFKDATDVANSPSQKALQSGSFTFAPGDIKYTDLSNDGKIDAGAMTVKDHGDLTRIGNTTPKYQYSFRLGGSWKGFDLEGYFQGVAKRDMWATGNIAIPGWSGNGNFLAHQMDYWTTSNTNAPYPVPYQGNSSSNYTNQNYWVGQSLVTTYQPSGNNFYPQTKYLLNLAYLRLKTISLGYTLPTKLVRKAGIDKLRIYFEGMNLLTFSQKNIPIDPEITSGSTTNNWYGAVSPFNKVTSFGLQLTF